MTSTKRQKMSISRSVVEAVRSMDPPGRFLEKNAVTGLYSDIGERKAIEKTSQALRDGAAKLRKQLSADLGDPDFLSAVFDVDASDNSNSVEEDDGASKTTTTATSQEEQASPTGTAKATLKDKVKSTKVKPVKKTGHRRTNSNPDGLSAARKKSLARRVVHKQPDSPPAPLHQRRAVSLGWSGGLSC